MKRFFLVAYSAGSGNSQGFANMGFCCDEEWPLNNVNIRKKLKENFPDIDLDTIVVINIYEFRNADDYIKFWKK